MTNVAPACPISRSTFTSPATRLVDQINNIPKAHDLPSVINALNIMNNIIQQLTIGEPIVNNVYPLGVGGMVSRGGTYGTNYGPADWVLEDRVYTNQTLVNPDNDKQSIKIKTLTYVKFRYDLTNSSLIYTGTVG